MKRQRGSHRRLVHADGRLYTFAWHDRAEVGPVALARIAAETGLTPDDL